MKLNSHCEKVAYINQGEIMKYLILTILISISTINTWAVDYYGELFNQRMTERFPERNISTFNLLSDEELPIQVAQLKEESLEDLLQFARDYDLQDSGWSYALSDETYEVINGEDQTIAFNFSILIYKYDTAVTRRFYQASRRVDGIFYIERIANYDL